MSISSSASKSSPTTKSNNNHTFMILKKLLITRTQLNTNLFLDIYVVAWRIYTSQMLPKKSHTFTQIILVTWQIKYKNFLYSTHWISNITIISFKAAYGGVGIKKLLLNTYMRKCAGTATLGFTRKLANGSFIRWVLIPLNPKVYK